MSSSSKSETDASSCLFEGCGKVYGSKAALQRHARSKHSECLAKEGRYECPVKGCNKKMYRAGLFVRHLEKFHEVHAGPYTLIAYIITSGFASPVSQ